MAAVVELSCARHSISSYYKAIYKTRDNSGVKLKLLTRASTVFDRILELSALLAAVILLFIMLLVSAGVILRYFFHNPLRWSFDVSEIALLYITFLGTAWLLRAEGHVKVDILISRFKPTVQAYFGIFSSIVGIIISWVLVWYGAQVTIDHFQRGIVEPTAVEFPVGPILLIIPLGSILLFIQSLRRSYGYLADLIVSREK